MTWIIPATFKVLVVKFVIGVERFLLADIYRPPDTNLHIFSMSSPTSRTPWARQVCIQFMLMTLTVPVPQWPTDVWLSCYNLAAVNCEPTRMHNHGSFGKLNLILESDQCRRLSSVSTIPTSYSDHRLVKCQLSCMRPPAQRTTYSYRDIRWMDLSEFEAFLRNSSSLKSTPADVDDIVQQLDTDLMAGLDCFAPLQSRTKRQRKRNNRWMSP